MRAFIILLAGLCANIAGAQTIIHKTYPVKKGQEISLKFDYPNIVRVSTWDKDEIAIQASVTVNNGKDDSIFVLQQKTSGNLISVSNKAFEFNKIPYSYTLVTKGGVKVFSKKEDMNDYIKKENIKDPSISMGNSIEVLLEIKVPANTVTNLKSVYGMVELKDFNGPLTVNATYGGIDASLPEQGTGMLSVSVRYGEIFSNLNLANMIAKVDEPFHTAFRTQYGKGSGMNLESDYGNIYLRK